MGGYLLAGVFLAAGLAAVLLAALRTAAFFGDFAEPLLALERLLVALREDLLEVLFFVAALLLLAPPRLALFFFERLSGISAILGKASVTASG